MSELEVAGWSLMCEPDVDHKHLVVALDLQENSRSSEVELDHRSDSREVAIHLDYNLGSGMEERP